VEDLVSFWKNVNVFVTGASGLLGSRLVRELVDRDANVVCLLRDRVPGSPLFTDRTIDRVNVVHGELEDAPLLARALNEFEVSCVFHLGAQTIVGTANRSALSTFESNVRGTWNLLEACRGLSGLVDRIVVASSDKAYGVHDRLPYTEDAPLAGRYPYDVSKSCADLITHCYHHTWGLPVAITRCGNLYGGGDLNFNRIVPGTIRSALAGESPIIRSDGTFVRDYFYVEDAVDAYLLLAERLDSDAHGEAFNFGTETPLSVLELVARILTAIGRQDLEPTILDQASREIPRQFLDCTKARKRFGWTPRHTLEEGLALTVAWYRDHLDAGA